MAKNKFILLFGTKTTQQYHVCTIFIPKNRPNNYVFAIFKWQKTSLYYFLVQKLLKNTMFAQFLYPKIDPTPIFCHI